MLSLYGVAIVCLTVCSIAEAATRVYDWNITWVLANPDGEFWRATIGINHEWPLPTLYATVGDQVVVNVNNQLGNQSTSIHFHGLYMNGTPHMDGPSMVTQCPILAGSQFTYNFTVAQPGTYWYHSHNKGQYPDGLRGALIVDDPQMPFKDQYSEELFLTVSDWYHDQMTDLIPKFISRTNPTGAEPVPNNALMNETQDLSIAVQPGKTYLIRVINIGAFAGQYFWIEGHNISIVEVDGIYTQPAEASMIYLSAAQRYSFLLTTKNDSTANFPLMASMDTDLFDKIPDDLNWNVTGWLVYDDKLDKPAAADVDEFDYFDDFTLVPYDQEPLLPDSEQQVTLTVIMDNLGDGANYAFFNDITYVAPKVPTLYTALSTSASASDPTVYGTHTHPFVLSQGSVVDIVVNNNDSGKHPFHLHGHNFQAIARSDEEAGNFDPTNTTQTGQYPPTPMRRDTLMIPPMGYIVLRFKADNPGIWLFHCHIEWHVDSGLSATMIEAPLALQQLFNGTQGIPADHIAACKTGAVPYVGNAAGNAQDPLNLQGQNVPPDPLPEGFTKRGIIALVFSCLAGILGMAVIIYYGLAEIHSPTSATDGTTVILK